MNNVSIVMFDGRDRTVTAYRNAEQAHDSLLEKCRAINHKAYTFNVFKNLLSGNTQRIEIALTGEGTDNRDVHLITCWIAYENVDGMVNYIRNGRVLS